MHCPKCSGTMRSTEARGIPFSRCTQCDGIWIDTRLIEHRVVDSTSRQSLGETIDRIVKRGRSVSAVECPRCELPLHVRVHKELEVDWCTTCRGIYLDAGELEKVQRLRRVYSSSDPGASPKNPGVAERVLEEVLGDVLWEILGSLFS